MKKSLVTSIIVIAIAAFGTIGGALSQSQTTKTNTSNQINLSTPAKPVEKVAPVCDGTNITKDCTVEGINYSTYIYHPPVAEQSHTETTTTYRQEISSYCTLCNDGTFSPSCATGRGACSHHGGVDEWNAPRYSAVPVHSTKKIIDVYAKEAYYEKLLK